jgi:hypothetical protein
MLDENIWMLLSEDEKFVELQSYLNSIIQIDSGSHEISHTSEQGKLAAIKKELEAKIFKVIELENAS